MKGVACTYQSGSVVSDHSSDLGLVASTIAHEMGHILGMGHDTNGCKCAEDTCIMSPTLTENAPLHWSSCSIVELNKAFRNGNNYCL